ncbi:MAG: ThuA domain-containing protein, partial [Bacillota bacterium]
LVLLGDYYHSEDYLKEGLGSVLKQENIETTYINDPSNLNWNKISNYDLIINSKAGWVSHEERKTSWLSEENENKLYTFVENGGGYLVLHTGLTAYPTEGKYHKLVKGYFDYHPDEHQLIKVIVKETHPVVESVNNFEIEDEQYFLKVNSSETNILLEGVSKEGKEIAGWAHKFNKGKVCCLTPGHKLEVLKHPEMKKLLANAINWCLN